MFYVFWACKCKKNIINLPRKKEKKAMKDIKLTLKAVVERKKGKKKLCMAMLRKTIKDYALLAFFVAATAYLFMHIYCTSIIPAFAGTDESFFSRLQLSAKDYGFIALFVASFLAMLYASLRAHRCMARTIGIYSNRELGSRRRTMLIVECTTILIASFCVAAMPPFILFCSAAASARSDITDGALPMPTWGIISFLLTTFMAALFAEITTTFVRLCFRELTPAMTESDLPAADKTPNVQQN